MNNRISIRSTLVLMILGFLAISLLWIVENTKVLVDEDWHQEKEQAALLMKKCMEHIKNDQFANEIAVDNINDPNGTGLIGQQFTEITSGRGSLPIKLSTTNPNFAALVVQLFKDAGLKEGDEVAMCFTGSFPAVNIAVCSAIDVLKLRPLLITSVTSSSWGANDPEFTWIDMHQSLYEAKLLSFRPLASSIGGNEDLGKTLSTESRQMAEVAISRNNLPYINENSLGGNISKRMEIFRLNTVDGIKLYVNVGGGIASFGSSANFNVVVAGLNENMKIKEFPVHRGIIYEMVEQDISVLNFLNQGVLLKQFGLPNDPVPLPKIGEGKLYSSLRYDVRVVGVALVVLSGLLISVIYIDKKQNKLGSTILSDPESI
ncbi:MAG: poly-gamma-glutamate system protein [Flavobacteriales bacterium]|nr:poly-gamma-glutamate system protein [Flavobacteriales bacterium]